MKISVAILGATGTVGQKVIKMLEHHPLFEIGELVASDKNAGKKYGELGIWRESPEIPKLIKLITLKRPDEISSKFAISCLPSNIAENVEKKLLHSGVNISSNAGAHRMLKSVPLVIPEINSEHISLLKSQTEPGKLITNPNCATVFLAMGLAPLISLGEIKHVSVVTLQAISGAGYPGIPAMDIMNTTIPNIEGEEHKIETEIKKILGEVNKPVLWQVTANVNRVPVKHGHTVIMHVFFKDAVTVERARKNIAEKMKQFPDLYQFHNDSFRPTPAMDITAYDNRTHLGRLKQGDSPNIISLVSMGHNLVRGAAGAAILNLELLQKHVGQKE